METADRSVGFIGVGMMGGLMAQRLMQHGIGIFAYDRNAQTLAELVAQGARAADSARDVADQCAIVFACLPTPEICKAVALGEAGVHAGRALRVYIETSTLGGAVAVEIAEGLAAKNIAFIDSPVVGGTVSVANGQLGVLAAGPKAAFDEAKFALDALAGKLFYLGERAGMGQAGKVMNNAITYAAFLATCEAVCVGLKAGLDLDTAIAIINQGSGSTFWSQRVFPNMILKGIFEGTGAIEIGQKDVKLFIEEARARGLDTTMADAVAAYQQRIVAAGEPGRDTLQTLHYFTDAAGLPRQG